MERVALAGALCCKDVCTTPGPIAVLFTDSLEDPCYSKLGIARVRRIFMHEMTLTGRLFFFFFFFSSLLSNPLQEDSFENDSYYVEDIYLIISFFNCLCSPKKMNTLSI